MHQEEVSPHTKPCKSGGVYFKIIEIKEHMSYQRNDISQVVSSFESKHGAYERYASFDYCYNYFHPKNKNDITLDMEKSCLSLGFYLASWGMYRGSSFMLNKSSKNFEELIEYFAELPPRVWDIDAGDFNDENIECLTEIYGNIKTKLIKGQNAHLTLVTKIMLGVFGSVPAYDRFFINTFGQKIFKGHCGFTVFNKKSLQSLNEFYKANDNIINQIASTSKTIDFTTEEETSLSYTNSKVIDMYGFTVGLN